MPIQFYDYIDHREQGISPHIHVRDCLNHIVPNLYMPKLRCMQYVKMFYRLKSKSNWKLLYIHDVVPRNRRITSYLHGSAMLDRGFCSRKLTFRT